MMRTVLAVTVLAFGLSTALADPIADRKALMKKNGDEAKIAASMVKGEAPFDAAKAQTVFATFADSAAKAPALFPDNSKTGGDTAALPAIWENKADFDARLVKFGTAAKDAEGKVKDLESLKTTWGAFAKDNCGGCHEKYRAKKS